MTNPFSVNSVSGRSLEGSGMFDFSPEKIDISLGQFKTCRFERHQKECEGDERPKWAREAPVINPGEDKEVMMVFMSANYISPWKRQREGHFCGTDHKS